MQKVLDNRFDIGTDVAAKLGATVLLKGSPTVIFAPDGERYVVARGTAALGTGGSGDLLDGIAGTLLAQMSDPTRAACCAAWVHGRAAEFCGYVRGTTLEDVLYALPRAWNEGDSPVAAPVLAELPAVATMSPANANDAGNIELGPGKEFDLVRTIVDEWGKSAQHIGDDAAIITVPEGEKLVVTTDTSVDGVHFRHEWLNHFEIGYRATAAALSDLAAMGARPLGIVIALTLPEADRLSARALATGIREGASAVLCPIVGGDLSARENPLTNRHRAGRGQAPADALGR